MSLKDLSISWLLHSIKILLGDETIRRYIILEKFPDLKHQLKNLNHCGLQTRFTQLSEMKSPLYQH